jgi:hypothetical protein
LSTGIVQDVDKAKTDTKSARIVTVSSIGFVILFAQLNWNSIGNLTSFLINSDAVIHKINDDSFNKQIFLIFKTVFIYLIELY